MEHPSGAVAIMNELSEIGVGFSIDDFGGMDVGKRRFFSSVRRYRLSASASSCRMRLCSGPGWGPVRRMVDYSDY
jgi:hypothetical protein